MDVVTSNYYHYVPYTYIQKQEAMYERWGEDDILVRLLTKNSHTRKQISDYTTKLLYSMCIMIATITYIYSQRDTFN